MASFSPLHVLVLAGGSSAERDVSLESGAAVSAALSSCGHVVDVFDPAAGDLIDYVDLARSRNRPWNIVFPLVHGTGGEDGVLQRELDRLQLPYVGSSAAASELTFDKLATRQHLCGQGFRFPDGIAVSSDGGFSEQHHTDLQTLSWPVVVKPRRQGSSIGVSIVSQPGDLPAACELAWKFDDWCLIETFIAGRELTVPVIDGVGFPAIEIVPRRWYDYSAKYQDDETKYVVSPSAIPADLVDSAVGACQLCGVTGIARVDYRLDAAGTAFLLEINTIPGMTSHSLVPKSAAARGLTLGQLCEATIRRRLLQPGL